MPNRKPRVVVFFGGSRDNFDLSRETGLAVCAYLPRTKYQVTPVQVLPSGEWQVPLGTLPQQGSVERMFDLLFEAVPSLPPAAALERLLRHPVDAMLTTVRGAGGDDGALAQLGHTLRIPVVGSSSETCQQTYHKQLCAQRIDDIAVTPETRYYRQSQPAEDILADIRANFTAPLFLKPVSDEGSAGVQTVATINELPSAIAASQQRGNFMAQERAEGAEFNLTLIEDERGRVYLLPPTVVVLKEAPFYDHLAKRRQGRVQLHTAAHERNPLIWEAECIARDVYDELNCRGYASLDFISSPAGLVLLEVNTIPTFTEATPLKHQLHRAGLHPTALLDSFVGRTLAVGTAAV